MSTYTTQLRWILATLANKTSQRTLGYNDINAIISTARPLVFSFQYPYWLTSDKERFETMILRHFYMREIGQESMGLWKLSLEDWLNVEMPYYNKLYEDMALEYDVLSDYNEIRHYDLVKGLGTTKKDTGTISNQSSDSPNYIQKYLDTPQNGIDNLLNGSYLTNATQNTGNGSSQSTNTINTQTTNSGEDTDTYDETIKGKRGGASYGALVREHMDSLVNVDKQVLAGMEVLFMGIW